MARVEQSRESRAEQRREGQSREREGVGHGRAKPLQPEALILENKRSVESCVLSRLMVKSMKHEALSQKLVVYSQHICK